MLSRTRVDAAAIRNLEQEAWPIAALPSPAPEIFYVRTGDGVRIAVHHYAVPAHVPKRLPVIQADLSSLSS